MLRESYRDYHYHVPFRLLLPQLIPAHHLRNIPIRALLVAYQKNGAYHNRILHHLIFDVSHETFL